ncbi:MAG TPA: CpsB/CapC family capsule biosynthesis tyrosine phosphatase [Silvibacterium sp.]|nr:CpsB/CapC family capsule biosynthesis tyrosine phosphatase [Silvibacterium sp.]
MIDIHHHLLFGLDDGPVDIETSLEMIEMAVRDGITHIVCTPHANARWAFNPAINRQKLDELNLRMKSKVTLGLGCDFHLSYDNIEDALNNRDKYTINGKQYLLVEFADLMIPTSLNDSFYEMLVAGLQPIITHPERNFTIQKHPERMKEWLRGGCLVQVTAASLTGRFGRTAQAMAMQFLEKDWVHFLATDAHSLQGRPPILREAYEIVAKRFGKDTAERLCVENPRAAFYGEELSQQPEPQGIEAEDEAKGRQRKGLLGRLFSG